MQTASTSRLRVPHSHRLFVALSPMASNPTSKPMTSTAPAARAVLVVIPTLNEGPHIEALLDQLLMDARRLPPHVDFRIAVVDGGSTDETLALALARAAVEPRVHVLDNPKRIQSAAVNLAARRLGADVDVLIRCDAHAQYPRRFCERLIASLERENADAVVVPMDSVGSSRMHQAIAWVSNSVVGTGGSAHRAGRRSGFVDHGHHAAFRMDTFRRVGGYDESFTHNEDAEYDCRQRSLGATIYLDADIRVAYSPRSSLRALWRQYYRYGMGRSRTARRHRGSLRLRQLLVPLNFVVLLIAVVLAPWFPMALMLPAGYGLAVVSAALLLGIRNGSLAAVPRCALAAWAMHLAWGSGFMRGLLRREPVWQPTMVRPLWRRDVARRAA